MLSIATEKPRTHRHTDRRIETEPYFSGLSADEATEALHEILDWEGLMEQGTPPSLPLGVERRLRR